jgi:hypothetical protein
MIIRAEHNLAPANDIPGTCRYRDEEREGSRKEKGDTGGFVLISMMILSCAEQETRIRHAGNSDRMV